MTDLAVRAWGNLLLAGVYATGLSLGAMFFLSVQRLSGARWSESFHDAPSSLARILPANAATLFIVLVARQFIMPDASVTDHNAASLWMSNGSVLARAAICMGVWLVFARLLTRADGATLVGPSSNERGGKASAAFLPILALTLWIASTDWLMRLTADWTSTLFSLYVLVGFVCSALAVIILLAVVDFRRCNKPLLSIAQRLDLATWQFAFSCVWMYLWYCQYMLIWYTNQVHETQYFSIRVANGWETPFYAAVVFKWLVPFVLLMSRAAKKSEKILIIGTVSVLVGHWFDLYTIIVPSLSPEDPELGAIEAIVIAVVAGALIVTLRRAARQDAMV